EGQAEAAREAHVIARPIARLRIDGAVRNRALRTLIGATHSVDADLAGRAGGHVLATFGIPLGLLGIERTDAAQAAAAVGVTVAAKPARPLAVERPARRAVVARAHAKALGLVGIERAGGAAAAVAVGVTAAAEPARPLAVERPARRAVVAAKLEVGDRLLTVVAGSDEREREAEGDQD